MESLDFVECFNLKSLKKKKKKKIEYLKSIKNYFKKRRKCKLNDCI